jgi:hypothetical protein
MVDILIQALVSSSGCEIWINNVNTGYSGTIVDWNVVGQYTGCSGDSVSAAVANSMSACATGYTWSGNGVNASVQLEINMVFMICQEEPGNM